LSADEPALTAINMRLRDDYVKRCRGRCEPLEQDHQEAGIDFEMKLPHVAFHRQDRRLLRQDSRDPEGNLISADEWNKRRDEWLPSKADGDFIDSR
jgi:benzoyl-CoA 2,3-dioxygenase component B